MSAGVAAAAPAPVAVMAPPPPPAPQRPDHAKTSADKIAAFNRLMGNNAAVVKEFLELEMAKALSVAFGYFMSAVGLEFDVSNGDAVTPVLGLLTQKGRDLVALVEDKGVRSPIAAESAKFALYEANAGDVCLLWQYFARDPTSRSNYSLRKFIEKVFDEPATFATFTAVLRREMVGYKALRGALRGAAYCLIASSDDPAASRSDVGDMMRHEVVATLQATIRDHNISAQMAACAMISEVTCCGTDSLSTWADALYLFLPPSNSRVDMFAYDSLAGVTAKAHNTAAWEHLRTTTALFAGGGQTLKDALDAASNDMMRFDGSSQDPSIANPYYGPVNRRAVQTTLYLSGVDAALYQTNMNMLRRSVSVNGYMKYSGGFLSRKLSAMSGRARSTTGVPKQTGLESIDAKTAPVSAVSPVVPAAALGGAGAGARSGRIFVSVAGQNAAGAAAAGAANRGSAGSSGGAAAAAASASAAAGSRGASRSGGGGGAASGGGRSGAAGRGSAAAAPAFGAVAANAGASVVVPAVAPAAAAVPARSGRARSPPPPQQDADVKHDSGIVPAASAPTPNQSSLPAARAGPEVWTLPSALPGEDDKKLARAPNIATIAHPIVISRLKAIWGTTKIAPPFRVRNVQWLVGASEALPWTPDTAPDDAFIAQLELARDTHPVRVIGEAVASPNVVIDYLVLVKAVENLIQIVSTDMVQITSIQAAKKKGKLTAAEKKKLKLDEEFVAVTAGNAIRAVCTALQAYEQPRVQDNQSLHTYKVWMSVSDKPRVPRGTTPIWPSTISGDDATKLLGHRIPYTADPDTPSGGGGSAKWQRFRRLIGLYGRFEVLAAGSSPVLAPRQVPWLRNDQTSRSQLALDALGGGEYDFLYFTPPTTEAETEKIARLSALNADTFTADGFDDESTVTTDGDRNGWALHPQSNSLWIDFITRARCVFGLKSIRRLVFASKTEETGKSSDNYSALLGPWMEKVVPATDEDAKSGRAVYEACVRLVQYFENSEIYSHQAENYGAVEARGDAGLKQILSDVRALLFPNRPSRP